MLTLTSNQDLKTEGLSLMIVESGHINCAMTHPEVNNYVRQSKSATRSTAYLEKNRFLTAQMLMALMV